MKFLIVSLYIFHSAINFFPVSLDILLSSPVLNHFQPCSQSYKTTGTTGKIVEYSLIFMMLGRRREDKIF
jgi:hypothetical protein